MLMELADIYSRYWKYVQEIKENIILREKWGSHTD